jgi:MFS family permease
MVLSTVILALVAAGTTETQFLSWGWRLPFLLSVVLLALGLFVRSRVAETPVFEGAAPETAERWPLREVIRRHPKNLLLAVGIGFGVFVAQSTLTAFAIAYAVEAGFPRGTVLNALALSSALAVIAIPAYSAWSDRIGRRPVVLTGALAMAVFAFAMFPMIDTGSVLMLTLAVMYGPLAALYSEMFATRTRYTGASLGYQVSSTGAGASPLVFAAILAGGAHVVVLSTVIAACCLLTAVCIRAAEETHKSDLTRTTG